MKLPSSTVVPLLVVLLIAGGAVATWSYYQHKGAEEQAAADAREAARQATRDKRIGDWFATLEKESASLMPSMLAGVKLGMTGPELRRARRHVTPSNAHEDGKLFLEERFPNGAQALYGFDQTSKRLLQVQVLSMLPSPAAIGPQLTAMNDQYGTPTGVWDCPDTQGVPTRRFTWRHDVTAVADVFLVHPGGVSVTFYLAPSGVIGQSLQRSSCHPVDQKDLARFPVASAQQIRASLPKDAAHQAGVVPVPGVTAGRAGVVHLPAVTAGRSGVVHLPAVTAGQAQPATH